ncbi:MAG: zf-HC2 domain-containing protein [Gammaproteobacteria bacterium]
MTEDTHHPEDLLPWYVNGSLDAAEQQQVEAHLLTCTVCQREVALLRQMRHQVQENIETPATEFAWQRLRRDMRATGAAAPQWRQAWRPAMAAAAALVIVIQSVLLFHPDGEGRYDLAGDGHTGVLLQVKFNPEATEQAMRTTLQQVRAEIVAGPSASGVYRIRLLDGAKASAEEQQEALATLRGHRHVIDYLQRD